MSSIQTRFLSIQFKNIQFKICNPLQWPPNQDKGFWRNASALTFAELT